MTQLKLILNAAFLAVVLVTAVVAQTTTTKPGTVTTKVTIEAIDPDNRVVTLKGEKGNSVKVKVDKSVERFDQLKVGDVVTAAYSESVIVRFRKPGTPDPVKEKEAVVRGTEGKPGAAGVIEETLTVTIEEIDRETPSVTISGPEGNRLTYRVRDAETIAGLKVGDKADIVYRLGLLLKVDAPEK